MFGDGEIALRDIAWSVDGGGPRVLRLRLSWEATSRVTADYHVFVHVVRAKEGRLLTQSDGVPMYDRYPFSQFRLGEAVADAYDVAIPDGLPLEDVEVRLGIYDFATQRRLPVGGADSIVMSLR